jgi:hypothetical protein
MEPECSLLRSQVPTTCPYPEPAQASQYSHVRLPEVGCGSMDFTMDVVQEDELHPS